MFYQNDHMVKMLKEMEIREWIRQAETDRLIAACRPSRSIYVAHLALQALHSFGHLLLRVGRHLDQAGTPTLEKNRRSSPTPVMPLSMSGSVEAIVISLLGGLIGLLLGAGIIWLTKQAVPDLPVRLSAWIVTIAVGFSALVGVVSGIWPAMRAADLDPVEALRYE